jgi:hypothetical protein
MADYDIAHLPQPVQLALLQLTQALVEAAPMPTLPPRRPRRRRRVPVPQRSGTTVPRVRC